KEAMDYTGNKLKKHNLEAEKRLKKVEQDYLHTSQKYTESDSQFQSLYNERRRADSLCSSSEAFTDWCNNLVKKLHEALDKIPTTEETIDHSVQFSMSNSVESLEDEQCQKLDCEAIRDFREVNREIRQCARDLYSDSKRKVKHLWKKKDHLSGQWDEEKKHMLRNKEKYEMRIGAYPEAEYIKMVNDITYHDRM
ncbi:hypothetical protein DY000_02035591, partial [Brassica cretica]